MPSSASQLFILSMLLCSLLSACGGEDSKANSSAPNASAAATAPAKNASAAGNQAQPPALHCAP